jgi:hypothetical protein
MAIVSTALWLERNLFSHEIRAKANEHLFDHMVWSNAKNLTADFSW